MIESHCGSAPVSHEGSLDGRDRYEGGRRGNLILFLKRSTRLTVLLAAIFVGGCSRENKTVDLVYENEHHEKISIGEALSRLDQLMEQYQALSVDPFDLYSTLNSSEGESVEDARKLLVKANKIERTFYFIQEAIIRAVIDDVRKNQERKFDSDSDDALLSFMGNITLTMDSRFFSPSQEVFSPDTSSLEGIIKLGLGFYDKDYREKPYEPGKIENLARHVVDIVSRFPEQIQTKIVSYFSENIPVLRELLDTYSHYRPFIEHEMHDSVGVFSSELGNTNFYKHPSHFHDEIKEDSLREAYNSINSYQREFLKILYQLEAEKNISLDSIRAALDIFEKIYQK